MWRFGIFAVMTRRKGTAKATPKASREDAKDAKAREGKAKLVKVLWCAVYYYYYIDR